MDLVLKNCKVVKPNGIFNLGIAIDGGKIAMLSADSSLPESDNSIDAKGRYVLPGLVDSHMHFPWPPREDFAEKIAAETQACLYGGCTTAVHMLRGNQEISEEMKSFVQLYEQNGYMDVSLNAMVLSRDHINQFRHLVESGMVSFKFFMPYRVGTKAVKGLPQIDDGLMYLGFREIATLFQEGFNVHGRVHCENIEIFSRIKENYIENQIEPASWHETRPSICETESIIRTIYLAKATGCPITIVHMSTKESVDLVAEAIGNGVRVTGETCPQYLTLSVDNTDKNLAKVNPPIREENDNEKLWQGVKNGSLHMVGTDHWPIHREKKSNLWSGEVGLSTVECWLGILLSEGVNKGILSLEKLVEVCCYNPAKMFGLTPEKGMIEVGSDADIIIVDLNKEVIVGEKPAYSDTDYNIFAGWRLKGWPVLTMLRGKVVMEKGKIYGHAGQGKYLPSKCR
jgi:dihydroorotase (multifunctional complex type)